MDDRGWMELVWRRMLLSMKTALALKVVV